MHRVYSLLSTCSFNDSIGWKKFCRIPLLFQELFFHFMSKNQEIMKEISC